jgi:hypothetical protein
MGAYVIYGGQNVIKKTREDIVAGWWHKNCTQQEKGK